MAETEAKMETNGNSALEAVDKIYSLVSKPCIVIEEVRQACREARAIIIGKPARVGNAAAMRDALEACYDFIRRIDRPFNDYMQGLLIRACRKTESALSAPPRNCDMFKDAHDSMKAWQLEFETIKEDMTFAQMIARIVQWLFAQTEEGK